MSKENFVSGAISRDLGGIVIGLFSKEEGNGN